MNKLVLSLMLSAVILQVATGTNKMKEFRDKMKAAKEKCKTTYNVPEDEMQGLKQNGPQSEQGKCYVGCLMEAMGIIKTDGSFDAGKATDWATKKYPAGEQRQQAKSAIDTCEQEVTTMEKCETGAKLFGCFKKNGLGLFMPGKKGRN